MSDLTPITREEALLDGQDLEPITRKEQFIKRIYDKTQEVPTPITREEWFLKKAGEGGGGVTVEQLNATENGTYSEQGKAYSPVIVEVPQTTVESLNITANGTYTAPSGKAYSPVTVNVPLPTNANERRSVTSYPVTDSANYPLPKCDVTVTDADKCEVIVTTDNTITEDSGVYIERQSGGGNRELDAIVGGSIVWNQIAWMPATITQNGITVTNNNDGSLTINGTSTAEFNSAPIKTPWISGHVYYWANIPSGIRLYTQLYKDATWVKNLDLRYQSFIRKITDSADANWIFSSQLIALGVTFDNVKYYPMCFDLTAVFGTTIADYIYTLEQSTAGSGIAWLKSYGYLTEDYYGYTANKIESVSVARHVMKDSNDSVIGSYAISPITLRGIPKLNASNQLYYDGDIYEASGRVTRKYGIVDLGALPWVKNNAIFRTDGPLQNVKSPSLANVVPNIRSSIYKTVSYENIVGTDKTVTIIFESSYYEGEIWIHDETYTDAATFKAAMSGVYLVYEKATPTTESTSPFEANQIVDANGTEEYIDAGVEAGTRDVAIPVGHDTKYYNGKAYVKPLTAGTSDTISMADIGIMPTSPMNISANGSVDVEYWKSNS